MTFTFVVTNEKKIAGLIAACAHYNSVKIEENPEFEQLTPEQYVEFVMNSAMDSYAANLLPR